MTADTLRKPGQSPDVLARALAAIQRARLPLAGALDPARRDDYARLPGISQRGLMALRALARSQGHEAPRRHDNRGGGSPALAPGQQSVMVLIRVTPAQRERLRALGGSAWVRRCIDATGGAMGHDDGVPGQPPR